MSPSPSGSTEHTPDPGLLTRLPVPVRWLILLVLSFLLSAALQRLHRPGSLLLGPMVAAILAATNGARLAVPRIPYIAAHSLLGCVIARSLDGEILQTFASDWPIFLAIVLAVIGAAYAKDVVTFGHVADLAKAFEVDLRDSWKVDQAFLDRYTKEELKFIARECGLVAHIGQKAFAKRLAGKKSDLITSMLNAIGFDWSGRLPSAMTLDCTYGPPPSLAAPQAQLPVADLAA